MNYDRIRQLLQAKAASGAELLTADANAAYASDMMSDVLAFVTDQSVLLTGLVNEQVIRTAAMLDMKCVILVRNKQPTPGMLQLAAQNGIAILTTGYNMYESCGILYSNGLKEEGTNHG